MKKIFIISALMLLAFMVGCEKEDDYVAPFGDFSSLSWVTTQGFEESDYVSALNNYIGFRDISKNALTHSWHIPSGTNLLQSDFNAEQDTIYTDFIGAAGPRGSDQKLINVIFRQPGVKEVELRNTFKDSVAESVFSDGVWKVNKIFTVTVFDDVKPMFKVMKGTDEILTVSETDMPSEANAASWQTVTVEAGEQLTYIDLTTTGDPDGRTWNFNGGAMDMSGGESVNLSYNGLGNFTAGSITSKRTDVAKPDGEATKLIPLNIEVVPSSQPFVLNGMITEDLQVISLNVTGEIETLVGEEANFTVHVVNTTAGFDQNIAVQSATVNNSDATQIDLVLSAPIYNSDVITVAYTAGNIGSVDFRVLESFSATNVSLHRSDNIITGSGMGTGLDYTGFEVEASTGNFLKKGYAEGYWVGNTNSAFLNLSRTTDMSNSGSASMRYESPSGVTTVRLQGSWFTNGTKTTYAIATLPAGDYEVSYMVFLAPGNTMLAFETEVQGGATTSWDISSLPRGQWVEISKSINLATNLTNKKFDLKINAADNAGVTGEQIMYFDDLSWRLLEAR
ncbi:hypothetical protein IMCC3317_46750 [Kordia antarctica]|uniref:Uncharacterized protein n=1 Tax=Kordia antarctica TaxID=1218801 RepID=A0A7L4ZS86_9FLAO|nr:hypothetical protein [Kordia antarctica]QHI39270.1 hypothetical protein IMCC3317_46750 [Kordia antarctica]